MSSYFKKGFYIIIIFIAISLFCTLFITSSIAEMGYKSIDNNYLSLETYTMKFNNIKKMDIEDLQKIGEICEDVLLYKLDEDKNITGIYFKGNKKPDVPMIEGRYFTEEDFNSKAPLMVIGKENKKQCKEVNGKLFFNENGVTYEVIGIMGYKDKITELDLRIQFSLSGIFMTQSQQEYHNGGYAIDAGGNTSQYCQSIKEYLEHKNENASVYFGIGENSKLNHNNSNVIKNVFSTGSFVFLLIICIALNIIGISDDWIEGKKKELAVKKAFGATDDIVRKDIIGQYIFMVTIAFVFGVVISCIIIKGGFINRTVLKDIKWYVILISYAMSLIFGLVTVQIPIKKAEKLEVNELMK